MTYVKYSIWYVLTHGIIYLAYIVAYEPVTHCDTL